jgi:hypothetical protein
MIGLVLILLVSLTLSNIDVRAQINVIEEPNGLRFENTPIVLPRETNYGQMETSAAALDTCENLGLTSITASGYIRSNTPNRMIDGDANTKWSTLGTSPWITLDLGSKKTVCSLDILWDDRGISYTFAISVSDDGINFSPPVFTGKTNPNSGGFETYILPSGVEGKFIKVSIKSNNWFGYSGIY